MEVDVVDVFSAVALLLVSVAWIWGRGGDVVRVHLHL
jgi:hypothetical protein